MIKEDRIRHMIRVAETMYEIAEGDESYKKDMYNLGLLHDIGRFIDNDNHEEAGADALKGYKYSEEIRHHGKLSDYHSKELDMLYYADMTSSPKGEEISLDERLEDIKERYGDTADTYLRSLEIVNYLKGLILHSDHMPLLPSCSNSS